MREGRAIRRLAKGELGARVLIAGAPKMSIKKNVSALGKFCCRTNVFNVSYKFWSGFDQESAVFGGVWNVVLKNRLFWAPSVTANLGAAGQLPRGY